MKKKNVSMAILSIVLISVMFSGLTSVQGQVFTAYLTSPMDNSLFGNINPEITLLGENITSLRAVPLDNTTRIISTLFEYSTDEANWIEIGIDTYEGYEGVWFPGGNGRGVSGWNIDWNITGLTEGDYYIRTTMTDASDQNTTDIRQVYYDPTPPRGQFVLPTGEIIGTITIEVEPVDGYPGYITEMLVMLYPQSGALFEQDGHGDINQSQVGPFCCGPTAAANALWFLAQKDPMLKNHPGIGNLTNLDIALILAIKMNTSLGGLVTGTLDGDLFKGLQDYLRQVGRQDKYTHVWYGLNSVTGKVIPCWEDYDRELRKNEAVIVLLGKWQDAGEDGVAGTVDDNFETGHYLTGEAVLEFTKTASFIDPGDGKSTGWLKWHEDGPNGYDQVEIEEGERWEVIDIFAISPTDEAKEELGWDTSEPIGEDYDGSDGWIVPWNSRLVSNGLYVVEVKMTDSAGNYGIDTMVVHVKNTVGGIVLPVDKLGLLAPYIGLASTIAVATVAAAIYVKRVKRRKEKQ